ncbi:MAG: iron chaperone [Candidatus Limnocylindrales bacterium]
MGKGPAHMAATKKPSTRIFSDEELAAMKESIKERKKSAKLSPEEQRAAGKADVKAKIAEMPADDRAMATRVYDLVTATAPDLVPRTFYGMPAWSKDGKVIVFFQSKSKFKVRYSTLGFQHDARLDDGGMWPVAFALLKPTPADEKQIAQLVKKAAGVG